MEPGGGDVAAGTVTTCVSESVAEQTDDMGQLAERVGFEPTVPCGTPDFESGTFGHSATFPLEC